MSTIHTIHQLSYHIRGVLLLHDSIADPVLWGLSWLMYCWSYLREKHRSVHGFKFFLWFVFPTLFVCLIRISPRETIPSSPLSPSPSSSSSLSDRIDPVLYSTIRRTINATNEYLHSNTKRPYLQPHVWHTSIHTTSRVLVHQSLTHISIIVG